MGKFKIDLFRRETAPGIILIISAFSALIIANSPLAPHYFALLDMPVHVKIGRLEIEKNFLLIVNDGLMAIFFLLIGLEVKGNSFRGLYVPAPGRCFQWLPRWEAWLYLY